MRAGKRRTSPRKKVLIVDDHPFVREGLKQVIDQQPDFIVCADVATPSEALLAIGATRPDVAVVDLSLENGSGLELIKEIRTRGHALPVLVLSMHEESLHAERVLRAGAQGYVMKRESPLVVVEALRQALAGKSYVSERMAGRLLRQYVGRRSRSDGEVTPLERLSDRELEIFQLIGQGHRRGSIAATLHISAKTVETHCERIKQKLNLLSADELRKHAFLSAQNKVAGPTPAES